MFEGIYFANPNYLWLFLVLPLLIAWHLLTWRRNQAKLKISSLQGFGSKKTLRLRLRPLLFVFCDKQREHNHKLQKAAHAAHAA